MLFRLSFKWRRRFEDVDGFRYRRELFFRLRRRVRLVGRVPGHNIR